MSDFSQYLLLLYFLTIVSAMLTRFLDSFSGNLLALISSFVAFLIAAFRPDYFPDVDTYELMFEHASSGDFNNPEYWSTHGEPGFKIFSYVLHFLGLGYDGFLIFVALLSFALLITISKISRISFSYLWFTYFSFFFITRDLGVIRVAIASHLVLMAFLQARFVWQFLMLALASFTLQYYVVVALLAVFMSRIKPGIPILISLMILSGAVGVSGILSIDAVSSFIPNKILESQLGTSNVESGGLSALLPIIRNLLFALLLYWLMKSESGVRRFRIWIWSAFLSVLAYMFFIDIVIAAQRFSAYFGAIFSLAFAYLLNKPSLSNFKFSLVCLSIASNFVILFYYNDFVWRLSV